MTAIIIAIRRIVAISSTGIFIRLRRHRRPIMARGPGTRILIGIDMLS